MPLTQVLVIEDDAPIRRGICDALQAAEFAAVGVESGEEGLEQLKSAGMFDLILLDVVLPGRDGMEVLQSIRQRNSTIPVIMLTARGDIQDRLRGLNLGADDYVVKPFNVRELLARIEAVLRRCSNPVKNQDFLLLPNGLKVNFVQREVSNREGRRTELSELETDLLRYISSRAGAVISREELIEHVWHINPQGMRTRTVDMNIARLRKKLGDESDNPRIIITLRGRGYRFQLTEETE